MSPLKPAIFFVFTSIVYGFIRGCILSVGHIAAMRMYTARGVGGDWIELKTLRRIIILEQAGRDRARKCLGMIEIVSCLE